jgi:hypothetical protein
MEIWLASLLLVIGTALGSFMVVAVLKIQTHEAVLKIMP